MRLVLPRGSSPPSEITTLFPPIPSRQIHPPPFMLRSRRYGPRCFLKQRLKLLRLVVTTGMPTVCLDSYYKLIAIQSSTPIVPGLRALALNSMWGDPLNFFASLGNVSNERERFWVEDELRAARSAGEKVYILGHIPPGAACWNTPQLHALLPQLIFSTFFSNSSVSSQVCSTQM